MDRKKAIEMIEEKLDGFYWSMEQRQEWLKWAYGYKTTNAMEGVIHAAQIVEKEAQVLIMSKMISSIREIVERIDNG